MRELTGETYVYLGVVCQRGILLYDNKEKKNIK